MRRPQSLRTQLLLRLAFPMVFFVILDAGVSYYVALHYANLAYDRWLLDSARSLAQEVKAQKGRLTLELPPTALEIFAWDDVDKTFFKIESSRVGFMAGDTLVPSPPDLAAVREQPSYFDSVIRAQKVRVVSMLVAPKDSADEVVVQVAETLNKRRGMTVEILLAVLLPQLLLVLVGGAHVWVGINRGLRPLSALTHEIAQRSPRDLTPIPDTRVPLEVRTLTHTINELLARLAATIETQQRFIANAAHQLRTPLAGLKVQAERALREQELAAVHPALDQIQACANRASRLSTQLLVLARSETAMDGLHNIAAVDLSEMARAVAMDWVPRALQQRMEIGFAAPKRPVWVQGDETLLRELLNNLLDNAVRYGGAAGQISVSLRDAPSPRLRVDDGGPGIPEQEREKIFERFYRVPGSSGDGCGLGLAIVKEIADLHRARVRIGARPGATGTRIEIRFPLSARG